MAISAALIIFSMMMTDKTPLFLISVSDLVYGIVQYGFLFLDARPYHFLLPP